MKSLLFFPGLGADERLFNRVTEHLPDFECLHPALPGFRDKEPLSVYANRTLKTLDTTRVEQSVLVGMSFGGQLAIEIAKNVTPHAIVLIACHRHSARLTRLFRMQFKLGRFMPYPLFKKGLDFGTHIFRWREGLAPPDYKTLNEIAADVDPYQLVFGAQTAASWEHSISEDPSCPIVHIQGTKDWVIPYYREDVTHPILDARHLIQFTHAAECADLILEVASRSTRKDPPRKTAPAHTESTNDKSSLF